MNIHHSTARSMPVVVTLVATIVGGALLSNQVLAQEGSMAPSVLQGISVVAPHVVRRKTHETGPASGPIEVLSLSRTVSFADLDLRADTGVAAFEKRVHDTAQAACDKIEAQYPQDRYVPTPAQDCVKTTIDGAMPQVRQVVAAAGGRFR
jgi:UrcA family protein